MLILAFESSSKPASVAVCSDGILLGQYFQNSGLTHSRTLLAMAASLLKNLDLSAKDIDLVAVSRGPGSFTGVRIGVSAAKGLAWGMDKPVCGVSTLEAMAYQAPIAGMTICPVMDARRSQVYNALFKWQENDGAPTRLCDDRAISLEDLAAGLRAHPLSSKPDPRVPLSGSSAYSRHASAPRYNCRPHSTLPSSPNYRRAEPVAPFLLIGDGAAIGYDHLTAAGIPCRLAPGLLRWQTAYGVALASAGARPIPAVELEPSYLRPSQAERERAQANGADNAGQKKKA